MPSSTATKKKSTSDHNDDGPDLGDRAASGLKAAEHIQKAMAGGTIRKAFSGWRALSHLRTAAAGTGDVVKDHPVAAALAGGTLAAVAIYYVARSMAAQDDDGQEDEESESQGHEDEGEGEAEGSSQGDEADAGSDDADGADEEAEPATKRSRAKARQRA